MTEIQCPKCKEKFKLDDSGYAAILKQVESKEFNERVNQGIEDAVKVTKAESDKEMLEKLTEKDKESQLQIKQLEDNIKELKSKLDNSEMQQKLAVEQTKSDNADQISTQQQEIVKLKAQIENAKEHEENEIRKITDQNKYKVKELEDELERVKQFKQSQSTKMIGESLERYCEDEFNALRAAAFSTDEFYKDNKPVNGSKGDYIYRAKNEDGFEYLSIMFEMKNEEETSSNKKRNEDHFAKLDRDRKNKNCEYAVLVSMLEQDSNLYNNGIVEVSGEYEKMYVIRPQFFITFITTLREFAKQSLNTKIELMRTREMNIDITNFEEKINEFKEKFGNHYSAAATKFESAIKEIDKSIAALQKTRNFLTQSEDKLRLADKDTEKLSVKKLTRGNPTMKEMFNQLNN